MGGSARLSRYLAAKSPPLSLPVSNTLSGLITSSKASIGICKGLHAREIQSTATKSMSSFGKLYGYAENPRSRGILAVAKANALELEVVRSVPREGFSNEYWRLNKLGRIPTFEGSDGFVLSEAIAIAVYVASQNNNTMLLGSNKQEYASILQWMSFFNSEVQGPLGRWWRMLLKIDAYDDQTVAFMRTSVNKAMDVVEGHLELNGYLVTRHMTVADYFCAGIISRGFEYTLDRTWRREHPHVTSWFESVVNQAPYIEAVGESKMIDEVVSYTQMEDPLQ